MASINLDILSKTTNPQQWIPVLSISAPVYDYLVSEEDARQLIQIPSLWIYIAGTKITLSGNNWYDYFPGGGGGGGGGGGDTYSKGEIDQKVGRLQTRITSVENSKADKTSVYTKTETDSKFYNKTQIDQMIASGSPVLKEPKLVASETIGIITPGKTYEPGTELEKILRDILTKYTKPTISLVIDPSATLYDAVTGSISKMKMTTVVRKNTKNIVNVKFFVGTAEVHGITSGVANGGTFTFTYTPSTPIKQNTTFKVSTSDGESVVSASTTVVFIGKTYYGTMDSNVSQPTAAQIKALNTTLKNSRNYNYQHINMEYGKVVYAYPKSLGALTSIKDPVNNINYTDTFARTEVTIDDIAYYCYTQIDPSAAADVQINFA